MEKRTTSTTDVTSEKKATEQRLSYDKNVDAGYYKGWLHETPITPGAEAIEAKQIGAYQIPTRTATTDIKFKDSSSPTLTNHSVMSAALQKTVDNKEWQNSEADIANDNVVAYMEYQKPQKGNPEEYDRYMRAVSVYPVSEAQSAENAAKRQEQGLKSATVTYPSSLSLQDGTIKLPKGTAVLVRDYENLNHQDREQIVAAVESGNHIKTSLRATTDGKVGAVVENATYSASQREAMYDAGIIPDKPEVRAYKSNIKASVLNDPLKAAEKTHGFVQEVGYSASYGAQHSGIQHHYGSENTEQNKDIKRLSYDNTKQQQTYKAEEATLNVKPTADGKLGVQVSTKDATGKTVGTTTAIRDPKSNVTDSVKTEAASSTNVKTNASDLASKNFESLSKDSGQSQSVGMKV